MVRGRTPRTLHQGDQMDNIFKTRVISASVNKIKPVKTTVLDKVFGKKKQELSDRFAFDIKSSSERILKNIKVTESAQVTDKAGRKTVTCEAPRFAEKRLISAADLNAMRGFGDASAPELLKSRIADEQMDMRTSVDRTREFMAVKALTGQVVDESGAVIVDYGFVSAQKPVLTSTAKWDDAGDPMKNIRAWKKVISDEVTVDRFYAFCGSKAMDALLGNPKALEFLKYTIGNQLANEGRITNFGGLEIEEYFGTYKDASGNRQPLIPEGAFIIVGVGADIAAELFAPVVDLEAGGGVGSGNIADMFFSKAWDEKDPSGKWIKVEARPLPVLFQPGAVVYATVV